MNKKKQTADNILLGWIWEIILVLTRAFVLDMSAKAGDVWVQF